MTTMPRAFAATAFALLAGPPLLAGPYDGIYQQTLTSDCETVGEEGGAIRIDGTLFYGVEVQCRMTLPVDINNMDATIYTMECSGEGQGWTERAIVMNDAEGEGIFMVWNGYVFRYALCPGTRPAPPGEEAAATD